MIVQDGPLRTRTMYGGENMSFWNNKVMPFFESLTRNKYLNAVSQGMMNLMPILLMGSLAVLLLVFPIKDVQSVVATIGLTPILASVNNFTIGFMAVYVSFFVARALIQQFDKTDDGVRGGILSLLCFFIITPLTNTEAGSVLSFDWLGASGVFTAMFTGLFVGRLYILFIQKGITLNLSEAIPPMIRQVFSSLVPFFCISVIFMIISILFNHTTYGSVHQAVYSLIQTPLKNFGGNIWSIILLATVGQLLWFFGIHGTNVTLPLMQPVLMAMDAENLSAAAAGLPMPNTVGYAFFATYTLCATSIGFAIMMLFAKSEQYKAVGKVAAPAAIFGISEPMVFGTPLVLNFTFAIPFILTNGIVLFIAYLLTVSGIVPPCLGANPVFGLPIGLHATIQGSWKIVVLQVLLQVVGALIYYPFFKYADKKAYKSEQMRLQEKE